MMPPEAPDRNAGMKPPAVSVCLQTLKDRPDFLRAAQARRQSTVSMVVQGRERHDGDPAIRVGFTCSKKVGNAVARNRATYDDIFVVYADCGTGGQLQAKCTELGVNMVAGPHCYAFFEGNDAFAARAEDEITAFYLTDFLVKQFDAFVWKPMGLDRHPELRDMLFGNYTKLVYQAQTEDPALLAKARDCADRLGLAFEYRFTGYGDLAHALRAEAEKT